MFEFAIHALETEGVSKEEGKQMVAILLREADFLTVPAAAKLGDQIMDNLKKGKVAKGRSLELFPKLLSTVGSGEVGHCSEEAHLDGDRKRRELIDCLCAVKYVHSLLCGLYALVWSMSGTEWYLFHGLLAVRLEAVGIVCDVMLSETD